MVSDNEYLAGTEEEIVSAKTGTGGLKALADPRTLFPHKGTWRIDGEMLVLAGWREIAAEEAATLRLAFTDVYTRLIAGGSRGAFPGGGFIGSGGKPLVMDLKNGERIYLLLGYSWWTGRSHNPRELSRLERWLAG